MDMVLLKSKGPHSFTRRVKIEHERGTTYEVRKYEFNFDNDFKCHVPQQVWEELANEYLDRRTGLRYRDFYRPL